MYYEAYGAPAFRFEDIEWTGAMILADQAQLETNVGLVRMLLENGAVPTKLRDTPFARRLPEKYDFDGVDIEFMPNFAAYRVGGISFEPPRDTRTMLDDIGIAQSRYALGGVCKEMVREAEEAAKGKKGDEYLEAQAKLNAGKDKANKMWDDNEAKIKAYKHKTAGKRGKRP